MANPGEGASGHGGVSKARPRFAGGKDAISAFPTLGFPTWSSNIFPCIFCSAKKTDLGTFAGFSPLTSAFPLTPPGDYEAACAACEQVRNLTQEQWALVKTCLAYNKAKDGPRGRALVADLPTLALLKHDRLQPDLSLQDVGKFEDVTVFPVRVTFWRRSAETRTRHRNPVFDPLLGISVDTLCVDTLHSLYLGPAKDWCAHVLWELVLRNVLGYPGESLEQRLPLSVLRIRNELWAWYPKWRREHPGDDITQLGDLTPAMLGSRSDPKWATKAMETKGIIPFCIYMLSAHASAIGAPWVDVLLGIGNAFERYISLLRQEPFVVLAAATQEMYDSFLRLFRLWRAAELPERPKLHLLMHLLDRTARQGNPAYYATWVDEGLNKTLAALGRQAHRAVWEARVLVHYDVSEKHRAKRPRF